MRHIDTYSESRTIMVLTFVGLLLLIASCLAGCRAPAPLVASSDTVIRTEYYEVLRDTIIYKSDSAGFRAMLECDSLGRVRLKAIENYYAGQMIRPKIEFRDRYIKVDCVIDSVKIYATLKDRYTVKEQKTDTVTIQEVNKLTSFQWFQIWTGKVLLLVFVVFCGYKIYRIRSKMVK